MPSENCPDEPMIARFAHGLLPEGVAESVVAHIETCAPCSLTAEEHARQGDRLIDELRDASHDNVPPDADCERTLRQLRQIDVASVLSRQPEEETVAPERIRDYQIAEKLGEGGMGIVFKAVHTRMDRTVAIKILSQRHLSRPDRVKRFEREVKAIARLEHPNIVRATDAGEEDGVPFLVMEYVDGADLSSMVKRNGPLAVADACDVIRQAAIGLQFAHDQGLVHRDVKPSNLMLSKASSDPGVAVNGRQVSHSLVKILDLGLARLRSGAACVEETRATAIGDTGRSSAELTRDGLILGTVDYMAPEQALDGGEADERSDIYSLGCTLYFLLTGQPPFCDDDKRSTLRTLARHQNESPRPLSDFRDDVPPSIDEALTRMMQKQPADRFADMSDVAAALSDVAATADLSRLPERQTSASIHRANDARNAQPAALVDRASGDSQSGWRRVGLIVLLGMLGGAVWFGITTQKVDLGHGTMEVEFDNDAFEGTVAGKTLILKSLKTGKSQTLKLTSRKTSAPMAPGAYEIVVATDSGLEIVGGPKVTIKTGETQKVVARYLPKVAPPDAHRRAAERILEHAGSTVTVRLADKEPLVIASILELPTAPFELTGLYALGTEFTNDDANLLDGLTSIQSLIFYQTSIDDDALSSLRQLHNCTFVALAECRVTSAGVIPLLQAMPKMTHLNVDATLVNADLLPEVAKCSSLQWLGIPDTIAVTELASLRKLNMPIYLRYFAPLADDDLKLLVDLPLEFLSFNAENMTGAGFSALQDSPTLTGLGLKNGADVSAQSLRNLNVLKKLQRLEFNNCALDREKLLAISEVRQLQMVQINADSLTLNDVKPLNDLPELATLHLFNIGLNAADIAPLRKLMKKCQVVVR